MRTRHGITQIKGCKSLLRSAQFQAFLDEHPEARHRWDILRPILDTILTPEQAANAFHYSERTIRRWKAQYDPCDWYSLLPASRRPHATPRTQSPPWMYERVAQIANDNLAWGAPKIADYIAFHDAIDRRISPRTVSRLLARGLQRGDIDPRVSLKKHTQTRRDVRGRTIKRVQHSTDPASKPGERVQADGVVVQIWDAGEQLLRRLYFSCAIDRFSRIGMVTAGFSLNADLTLTNYGRIRDLLGETIETILNDNGAENLGDCIEFYEGEHIIQLFTYPHAPKQNAVCERFNRTFQEECLLGRRIDLTQPLTVIQEQINAWLVHYNTQRPHESIGNIPPILHLFKWKYRQLSPERQADAVCGHMLWRGT